MSLAFLYPEAGARDSGEAPVARSPMEHPARAAGARFEGRDGWSVAVAYGQAGDWRKTCGWADMSHLGKLELQADPDAMSDLADSPVELGRAVRSDGAWWCPLTAGRVLVISDPSRLSPLRNRFEAAAVASVVDVSTSFAALALVGPLARELMARFCALDLRPQSAPIGSLRPGSVARQPGVVLREAEERYLILFGWAVGEYVWAQVEEAAGDLGGVPVGIDELAEPPDVGGVRSDA